MANINEKKRKYRSSGFAAALILFLAVVTFSAGCNGVRRRLAITSTPEGATVWLNDREIGQTPISQNITWSGKYKIRLAKEGMETKTIMHEVRTPWYLWPGVDFVSENLVPGELRDNQSCHVALEAKRVIPDNELFDNASELRTEAHSQANLRHYQGSAASEQAAADEAYESNASAAGVANSALRFKTPELNSPASEPISPVRYVAPTLEQ